MCSYEKAGQPGYRDLGFYDRAVGSYEEAIGRRNRDLGNRAGPPFHMNTSNFFAKEIGVKRDLGNRAIPVNRDHMKRPLDKLWEK